MPRSFNGNSANYLDFGSSFPIGATMAVACWVRFNTTAGGQFIIGRAEGFNPDLNPSGCWKLGLDGTGKVFFEVWPNGSTNQLTATSAATLQPGRWYHVVGQQGSNVEVFLNGVRDGLTAGSRSQSDVEPLRIGQARTGGNPLNGLVAHAAAWDTNLSFVEIFQLAQGALPNSIRTGRLYWWVPLDSPGIAIDRSVRHLDGTENGSVPPALDPQAVDLAYGSTVFTPSAPGVIVEEVDPPFGWAGATGFAPTIEGPVNLDVPFGLVGVTGFQPAVVGELTPPVGYAEPTTRGVTLVEGSLPPFVPPSLPPPLGGGAGPGGGGGVIPPVGPGVPLPPLSSGGLAGIRFYQGPPWRWVVTDLDTNTITFLDRLAMEVTVTYGLNRGATAKLSIPSANPEVNILHTDGEPFISEGTRLLYGFRREGGTPIWQVRFAGKILQVEDTGETENARTIVTAFDPWHLLYQRPMINEDGDFPDTAGFFSFDDTQAGNIALIFLRNTILNNGSGLNDHGDLGIDTGDGPFPGAEPGNLPGTSFWNGVYESTTQRDTLCQQGMMVGEVWDQQLETGSLDIVMTPIYDPVNRPGYMVDLSIYELVGSQKDDAVFAWDKPGRNLIAINALKDGTKRANTIRYYYGEGGPPSGGGIPLSYGPSILKYGETWHQQFYPGRIDVVVNALATLQLELMEDGIKTVHVTPAPERMPFLFTEFWLGDTVPVFASSNLRQSIAGYQRIYGVVLAIDENSYEQVPQLLVSPEDA